MMVITVKKPEEYLVLCLFFLFGTALLFIGASDALSQEDPITYSIPYIQSGPIIDGEITEGEWAGAERVYLENETHPSQNVPALVDTEVKRRLAAVVRNHYRAHPEAIDMQASGNIIPPTVKNHS